MLSDLRAFEVVLARATCPEDVFGVALNLAALKKSFHHIAVVVHPDKYATDAATSRLAQDLFAKLVVWMNSAEHKMERGTYGDRAPHEPAPPPKPKTALQIIETPKRRYVVKDLLAQGDVADVYACTYVDKGRSGDGDHPAAFKIAQSAADNDLMENESRTLSAMYPPAQKEERFYRYLPKPVDSFLLKSGGGAARRVNVMQLAEGYVSLAEVMAAYPHGLDYKDVVWMLKRNLAALWYCHRQKLVVHGCIIPTNLLVHPTGHGAKVVDWCYAVRDWPNDKDHVKAISKAWRAYYAPEILAKKPPTPSADLYMLAKIVVKLLGGEVAESSPSFLIPDAVPKPIRSFLSGMLLMNPARRPDDGGKLHEEFDELLLKLVGKPKYRPLVMPARTA
jgi:serine/threonine protein kinase